jgi:hypothetical protein
LRLDTNGVNKVSLLVLLGSLFLYVCNEVLSGKHLFTIFFDSLPNFLIACALLAIGTLITLAVVERALKKDKEKQWEKVRERTFFEIINYVSYIVVSVQLSILSIPGGLTEEERKKIKSIDETIRNKTHNYQKEGKGAAEAIGQFHDLLVEISPRLIEACGKVDIESQKRYIETIKFVYDDIKFSLDIFRLVLLPRVLNFSENTKMLEALVYFEIVSLEYERYMRSLTNPLYANTQEPFTSLIDLLYSTASVYWFIIDDLERNT